MFKEVLNAFGGFVEAGIDAAKAGFGNLFGPSGVDPSIAHAGDSAVPQGTGVPVGQTQGASRLTDNLGGTSPKLGPSNANNMQNDTSTPFWVNGTFQRYEQIGFYDFTTDPKVCGFYLDPANRWVKLRNKLFVPTPEMAELEAKYYQRVNEVASKSVEQKYVEKTSYLLESDETRPYSQQLAFDALTQAHEKYSTIPAGEGTAKESAAGRKPVPFQLALGSVIVQSVERTSDRGTGIAMSENPFIQYFCGFSCFSTDNRISHSKLSELKEIFNLEFMNEINEVFIKMKITEIHLEASQKCEKDVEKAEQALERAEKSAEQAKNRALKAKEAAEEVKTRFDGMASEDEVKAAEEKVEAAEKKVNAAEEKVRKCEEKLRSARKKLEEKEESLLKECIVETVGSAGPDILGGTLENVSEATGVEEEAEVRVGGMASEKEDSEEAENAEAKPEEAEDQDKEKQKNLTGDEPGEENPCVEGQEGGVKLENAGSISIDATYNPDYGKYPQDFDILNDARKKADKILSRICAKTGTAKPRTDKKVLQQEVKNLSKKKKKTDEDTKPVIKDLLDMIEKIFGYIDKTCTETGYELDPNEAYYLMLIKTVYAQQKYMFVNNVQRVPHRMVSFSMPQVRPIVRGKIANNYEFGPKTEISVDEEGCVRLENFSFEAFNEGTRLQDAVERYKTRTGHYPEVVRCDQIYRTRENRAYCKKHNIRMSGPKLGRKPSNEDKLKEEIELERADMVDRIEVERQFSRQKHCWGLECIMERTPDRMGHAVGMGVFLNNLIPVGFLYN